MDLKEVLSNLTKENRTLLYEKLKEPIFLFVLSITKNHSMSEDITQDVFIKILEHHGSYDKVRNPKPWVYTIARNTAYTYLKKQKEIPLEEADLNILLNRYNTVKREDSLIVEEKLSQLTDLERDVVILYVYGGLKKREIANVLNMEYTQVRSKYDYARKKLKEIVKNENEKENRK